MFNKIFRSFLITFLTLIFIQCNNSKINNTVKLLPSDPFKNTIVPSQTYEIDCKQDNIVEGQNGTVIVCPKGCFINDGGEIVNENVKIELSEAFSLEDMLLSNLTTTSEGKQLETDGMIYFNATANGVQLSINKENPIHIEIPTAEKKAGMMAFKGIRDEKGNMNWIEPKELDNYLVTVDINTLDFLPQGFQSEVEKGMPYKNYKTATQSLTDSLYYQLSVSDGSLLQQGFVPTNYNEPYNNKGKQEVNGGFDSNSNLVNSNESEGESNNSSSTKSNCGIEPAIIKVIKSDKYQNTFIATREFETRLKTIFKTCNNSVLEIYINNLDKNLYEVDSMAAIIVEESQYYMDFIEFSRLKLTKVNQANHFADLLKGYYEKQLGEVKAELEKEKVKLMKELNKKNEEAQEVANEYKKLLLKREKYRMETYGFTWSETGWINIDNGTLPKSWGPKATEGIYVDNGKEFDRVYSYIIFTSLKSLYRLNSTDNVEFYAGNEQDNEMLMPKDGQAILISIGYKGEAPSLAIKEFELNLPIKYNLTLVSSTIEKVREAIRTYNTFDEENEINKDLVFMTKLFNEEQRQRELIKESDFMNSLWSIAFPCCSDNLNGEKLFIKHCSSCHNQDYNKLIGPGLAYSTTKHSRNWLYKWTTNSQALINSGDKDAIKLFNDYSHSLQPIIDLTEQEVVAIYNYIDDYNSKLK